jgi:DNA-binding MarR family transcriptional regulator
MPRRPSPSASPHALQLESSLLYWFAVVANRAAAPVHALCAERYGMSVPAWRLMAHLGEQEPQSAKELGGRAAMDSVGVTRALNQLETLGLLQRTIDAQDRRRVVLRLTRKGRAAYESIAPLSVAAEQAVVAGLTNAQRTALYGLTRRVWQQSEAVHRGAVMPRRAAC